MKTSLCLVIVMEPHTIVTVLAMVLLLYRVQSCYIDGVVLLSGPGCRHRHVRRVMCINYLTGFCPEGPKCKFKQLVNSLHTHYTH